MKKYNEDFYVFLEENAKFYTIKELVKILKEKFNIDFEKKKLAQYCIKKKIKYKYEKPNKSHSNISTKIGTITNKTDTGCRVIAGNSTGTAKVRLYSPGTTAYNFKEVYITIHIKDDLIWVECNPHIYKNGKWIEMSPKIYKNGKWLSGIIKKYISKGDIYGK